MPPKGYGTLTLKQLILDELDTIAAAEKPPKSRAQLASEILNAYITSKKHLSRVV